MQRFEKPQRININGIICEYFISPDSDQALVLLEGLPAVPQRVEFINTLRKNGYSVFYPRFRGTWESTGTFLGNSLVEDVLEVATYIHEGFTTGSSKHKFSSICVLATSFAGAVALSLPKTTHIQKIVSLSPVFDFTKVVGIQTLKTHLRDVFTMAYRFEDSRWNDLLQNKIVAPVSNFDPATASQHLVLAGALDEQISTEGLEAFCKERAVKVKIYQNVGHISYSRISENVLNDIFSFLKQ